MQGISNRAKPSLCQNKNKTQAIDCQLNSIKLILNLSDIGTNLFINGQKFLVKQKAGN